MAITFTYGSNPTENIDEAHQEAVAIYESNIWQKLELVADEIEESGGTVTFDISQQMNKVSLQATGISDDLKKRIEEAIYERSEN